MNEKKTAPEADRELREVEELRRLLNEDWSNVKARIEIRYG